MLSGGDVEDKGNCISKERRFTPNFLYFVWTCDVMEDIQFIFDAKMMLNNPFYLFVMLVEKGNERQ